MGSKAPQSVTVDTWRRSWRLVALGVGLVVATKVADPTGTTGVAGAATAAAGVVVALGLFSMLRDRTTRGRATDLSLEILLAVASLGFAVGAAATHPGTRPLGTAAVAAVTQSLILLVVLWLLARIIEVTPEGTRPLYVAACGTAVLLFGQVWQSMALLPTGSGDPAVAASVVVAAGLLLWVVALVDPRLRDPGPTLPVSGTDVQATNLLTLVIPLLVGPLTAIIDMTDGAMRPVVVVVGTIVVPLLVVGLLVRQVQLRARREYLAQHDPLTGLPNQRLFLDEVEIELARTRRTGVGFAVMFLDLDRFKVVNDSLGHDVGDLLLQAVAERLEATREDNDVIARVGGDEFTVLVPGLVDRQAVHARAAALQGAFTSPLQVGTRDLFTGASVGIAVAPRDGLRADELLKRADTAMYRAKAAGPGRIQQYSTELQARARLRLALENELRAALDRGDLSLWYQPKVRAQDRAVVGHEALVRWNHRALGMVPPAAFVTLAEETGLIAGLGRFVMHRACRQVAEWAQEVAWPAPVAVKVSPAHVAEASLDALVVEALDATGVHPRLLEVEITESALLHDLEATAGSVARVRDLGVTVTLDDFGTGRAGLGYLTAVPLDRVKLDASFVRTIQPGDTASRIVEAVLAVASSLALEVVAEGVETEHQAAWLRQRGCDTFQGYLFGRPAPPVDTTVWVPTAVPGERVEQALVAICNNQPLEDPAGLDEVLALLEAAPTARRVSVPAGPGPQRQAASSGGTRGGWTAGTSGAVGAPPPSAAGTHHAPGGAPSG